MVDGEGVIAAGVDDWEVAGVDDWEVPGVDDWELAGVAAKSCAPDVSGTTGSLGAAGSCSCSGIESSVGGIVVDRRPGA